MPKTPTLELLNKPLLFTEPRVWIRRIVIYEDWNKKPIRDLSLKPGLNIVQTAIGESPKTRRQIRNIKGHGAGKTTLCRLIRYLLGEPSFGPQIEMDRIKRAFPNGYVAAKLMIDGTQWSVLRSIGSDPKTYISKEMTVEQLLTTDSPAIPASRYVETLGLNRLVSRVATKNGSPITWEHILPWFTRDEGADFRRHHIWREPSSESGSPSVQEADVFFMIRSALGFADAAETDIQNRFEQHKSEKTKVEREIVEFNQKPIVLTRFYRESLKKLLVEHGIRREPFTLPDTVDTDDGLLYWHGLVNEAKQFFGQNIQDHESEIIKLKELIGTITHNMKMNEAKIEALSEEIEPLDTQKQDANAQLEQEQKRQDNIIDTDKSVCPYVPGLRLMDCKHVKENWHEAYQQTKDEIKRLKSNLQKVEPRRVALQKKKQEFQESYADLSKSLLKAKQEIKDIEDKITEYKGLKRDIDRFFSGFKHWSDFQNQPGIDPDYQRLQKQLNKTDKNIAEAKMEFQSLRARKTSDRKLVGKLFSHCVHQAFGANYAGRMTNSPERIKFSIIDNNIERSSGTYDLLSTLLADLACLLYGSVSKESCLPGFMLYDSPKKYDMESDLYDSFFLLLTDLQREFETINAWKFGQSRREIGCGQQRHRCQTFEPKCAPRSRREAAKRCLQTSYFQRKYCWSESFGVETNMLIDCVQSRKT